MTLPEHIAEAVLELLKSIPAPDKADLEVCIRRALDERGDTPIETKDTYWEPSFINPPKDKEN